MPLKKEYVREDPQGVLRVGAAGATLDSIVAAFEQGHSAETIREQYPELSLEEVYGAIAYYLGHPDDVRRYLARQDEQWARWKSRSEVDVPPALVRLRSMRQAERR